MPRSTAGRSSLAPSIDDYGDEAPLTQEEMEALSQMEAASQPTNPKESDPSPPKKRKRGLSASPHLTPTRLRTNVKPTACAAGAGYKANTSHVFRQDLSSDMPPPNSAMPNAAPMPAEANSGRSASIGPLQQNVQLGSKSDRSNASADDGRRSLSIGPAQPAYQMGEYGNRGGMAEHPGAQYRQYQYMTYPGPGQSHPQAVPLPYFQHPGMPFGSAQNQMFYPNPPVQDQHRSRTQMDMPMDGPNPPADIFSPQYIPPQASALPPTAHSTSSSSTRRSTSVPSPSLTPSNDASSLPPGPSVVTEATAPAAESAEPTKTTSLPSATALPVVPEDPIAGSDGHGEDDEDAFDGDSKLEGSPTISRMSSAARDALQQGFHDLDLLLKEIGAKTGLSPTQIVERWDVTKARLSSSWNIYQSYFEAQRADELARLPLEKQALAGGLPTKATIASCYERFKAASPDSYDQVLRSWHRLRLMSDRADVSFAKRTRDFKKHTDKMGSVIRQASNMHGFETLCIAVGGVVSQDQALAQVFGSDATIDVEDGEDLPRDATSANGVLEKKEPTPVGEAAVPTIHELREKFIRLASHHKITVTKGPGLLWRALPQVIADAGCVLLNWPEDVPFPCDEAGKNASKGISVLKLPARALLSAAFSHPTHPLVIERQYASAVPIDMPVIIGVPPDSTSPHAYGRRKFLDKNLNEDRQGPPRLIKATTTSKAQKAVGRTSKKEPSTLSKKVKAEEGSNVPMCQLDDAPDGEVPDEDTEPKTKKKKLTSNLKGKPTSKAKPKVQFVEADEPTDAPYDSSQEGSAQYSCPDDDMPITRSPHLLRNKRKRTQTKQGASKRRVKKPAHSSSEDEGEASEASIIVLDATPKPSKLKSGKKGDKKPTDSKPTAEGSATDKLAETLFGGLHRAKEMPKSTASASASASASAAAVHTDADPAPKLAPAIHSEQPLRPEPVRPSIPLADAMPAPPAPAPSNNQPPPTESQPLVPQQQVMDRLPNPQPSAFRQGQEAFPTESGQPRVPQPQIMDRLPNPQPPAFRQGQETFYPANYAAYPDAYGSRYAPPPPEHHPSANNWGLAPGQGWYPSGPGIPQQPPTSNAQMSGPPQHGGGYWVPQEPPTSNAQTSGPPQHGGGYWAPQGPPMYPNPYGHYLAPNAQAAHPPQDDPSRARSDGQAGPSK
ncbi:hypothetical protein BJ912DRAFT_1063344 [Pholiota molesta]|nr:hypothetical protein BJ912DRAFT_1063344 [Pholiota molesta]